MRRIVADLVIKNGTVITVNGEDVFAEAVAVLNDIILWVGANEEIESLIGKKTRIIDLAGRTLVPGFIDTHTHPALTGEFLFSLNLMDMAAELTPSIADLQQKIKEKANVTPKGEWIGGRNYEPKGVKESRWPTREELDDVAPDNPVIIMIRGGHAHVVNSKALDLAGISKGTPNPEGGVVEKDPVTGAPTGVFRDAPLVKEVIPTANLDDLKNALSFIGREYAKIGVTSTGDAGIPYADNPDCYRAYQEVVAEGRLKTRIYLMICNDFYRENDLGLRTGFGNNQLRLGAVKLFIDGSIQCYTAAFSEPYIGKTTRGIEGLQYSKDRFNDIVADAHREGYQVAIHAVGDYGITLAVNAIEYAMIKFPRPDPRHRIEHVLCPTFDDLKRMKKLGIIPNFYFFHPWFWGDQHINEYIGKERADKMVPAKTAMKLGIISCAHSDCPICIPGDPVWPSDPLWGMWCAVNRKTKSGIDIGSAEKLTPIEALRIYTINGAYASFEEDIKGSIEIGKLADLVVLSDNPLEVDPWEIRNIKVEKTIIGGEIVYQSE